MTTEEEAEAIVRAADDDPDNMPELRWMPLMPFWTVAAAEINGEPSVVFVLATPALPNGIPFMLTRDRALKFASQIRRTAQTGVLAEDRPGPEPATQLGPRLWTPGQ